MFPVFPPSPPSQQTFRNLSDLSLLHGLGQPDSSFFVYGNDLHLNLPTLGNFFLTSPLSESLSSSMGSRPRTLGKLWKSNKKTVWLAVFHDPPQNLSNFEPGLLRSLLQIHLFLNRCLLIDKEIRRISRSIPMTSVSTHSPSLRSLLG